MKRRFILVIGFSLMCLPLFTSAKALTDVYGDSLYTSSTVNLLTPENAALNPDGKYADFRAQDTFLTIDMGLGEEGFGDLLVTMKVLDYGAIGRATLYDADWNVLTTYSPTAFAAGLTVWTVPYSGLVPYRYVKIESTKVEQWSVDAIQATQVNTPSSAVVSVAPTAEAIPYCMLTDCGRAGDLVKIADSSAVYFIGLDGARHAFPNQAVFDSWSYSTGPEVVSAAELANYPMGKNVTVRAGTYMVKIVHDPKVYFVEPGGVLRWVSTEAIAQALYGADWNTQIVDVDETFWKNYTVGTPMTSASDLPVGYHFVYNIGSIDGSNSGEYIVTEDGTRSLNTEESSVLRLDIQFAGQVESAPSNIVTGFADNSDLTVFVEAH